MRQFFPGDVVEACAGELADALSFVFCGVLEEVDGCWGLRLEF